jgi:UDP:flavonoid glycosyltransferase YjiC (YdhE family)
MTENAIRIAWSGTGLALPWRLSAPGPLRWAARRLLAERRFNERAAQLAAWASQHDGAASGARLIERVALM